MKKTDKIVENYLKEFQVYGDGEGINNLLNNRKEKIDVILELFNKDRYRGPSKENAPTFIYKILYGKEPRTPIRGMINSEEKLYKGIYIDKNIPDDSLDELNSIKEIEIRSSCEGHSPERPTFIIFRLKNNSDEKRVKILVEKLNRYKDIKAGYGYGNMDELRIGVTTNLYYDKNPKKFEIWWLELPKKIKNSLR
jgi:hypothetical protein